jgi:DNA-binding phage protein
MTAALARSNVTSVNKGRTIKIDDGPKTVALVQAEIWRAGANYSKIAADADLSVTTVMHIASGTTQYPRLRTIIRLLGALGWDIYAQERS